MGVDKMAEKKYLSLEGLQLYDQLLKARIDAGDARSIKTVALNDQGTKMLFYNVSEPVGSTQPVYEIEFPNDGSSLDSVMHKVASAINGNIGIFQNGTIVDSGKSFSDYYTKAEVNSEIARSNKLSKSIVNELPTAANAQENIIYMIKDTSATGNDKYKEYMLINGQLVMIGDTSTDMTDYVQQSELPTIQSTIATNVTTQIMGDVQDAIDDASDDTLNAARQYTDQEIGTVNGTISTLSSSVSGNTSAITALQTTVSTHTTQISTINTTLSNLDTTGSIAEADIRALFA